MKESRQNVSGVCLLNKPYGLSSNGALQKVRRIFNAAKAGHTGTLDPLATGLLPICFGEATKFSNFLLDADKEYIASIKLGVTTATYDAEGEILERKDVTCTAAQIIACVNTFLGQITQVPPIYSALKVNGKALYEYARNGEEVAIKSRVITIHELELINFVSDNEFTLRVLSSKGTYIRSLAHDIGQKLGCGAYLSGLIRTKTNQFKINQTKTLDELSDITNEERMNLLLPVDILVNHLNKIELSDVQYAKVRYGNSCESAITFTCQLPVRLYYNSIFLGIAMITEDQLLKPFRLCSTACL